MSNNTVGWVGLTLISTFMIGLFAAGLYHVHSGDNQYYPLQLRSYQNGGKKTYRKKKYRRKTRKL